MFNPKLIIFDLDGTLVEFHRDYLLEQTAVILPKLGHPHVPTSELIEHFSNFDYFGFAPLDEREKFIENFWQHFDWVNFPHPNPIPGALEFLSDIKAKNISTAIATARLMPEQQLRQAITHTGFLEHIDAIRTRAGEHVNWMDKTGQIEFLCGHFATEAAQVMFVGDVPTDISSAKQMSIGYTVAVLSGGIKEHILRNESPDAVIADISELRRLIKSG